MKNTTKKGHIEVKFSNHFTATIRSISDFKKLLADENEDKSQLEIIGYCDICAGFKEEIERLIEDHKNPTKATELYRYDRKGNIIGESTFSLKFHQDGKITILDGYADFSPTRKQKIKNGTHGQYLINVASGPIKWYLD